MKDLAPEIYRQRLIIEGRYNRTMNKKEIIGYLSKLSQVLKMKTLLSPVTHKSKKYGWAGWIHWESSGCHVYAWQNPYLFFSVDIYTCKKFDKNKAIRFTKDFFIATRIVHKEA